MEKIFCENCRKDVNFIITEEKEFSGVFKEVEYSYFGKEAHCLDCGSEIYNAAVHDYNLNKMNGEVILKKYEEYLIENNEQKEYLCKKKLENLQIELASKEFAFKNQEFELEEEIKQLKLENAIQRERMEILEEQLSAEIERNKTLGILVDAAVEHVNTFSDLTEEDLIRIRNLKNLPNISKIIEDKKK